LFDDTGGEAHAGFVKKFVAAQVVMMRACQHENIAQLFGVFQVQGSCGGFLGAWRQIADIHRFFGCFLGVRKMMEIHGFSVLTYLQLIYISGGFAICNLEGIQRSVMLIQVSKYGGATGGDFTNSPEHWAQQMQRYHLCMQSGSAKLALILRF